MSADFQAVLMEEFGLLFEPLVTASKSEVRRRQILGDLGWDFEVIPGLPLTELEKMLSQFETAYTAVVGWIEQPPESLDDIDRALTTAEQTFDAARRLSTLLDRPGLTRPPQFEKLGEELVNYLATHYLRAHHPTIYAAAELLTLIEPPEETQTPDPVFDPSTKVILRSPRAVPKLRLDRLPQLLSDPAAHLRAEYLGPDGLVDEAAADRTAYRLFPRLCALLMSLGVRAMYGVKPYVDLGPTGNALAKQSMALAVPIRIASDGSASAIIGAVLSLSSKERGDLGLVVTPFGALTYQQVLESWLLQLGLSASVEGFAIGPQGFVLRASIDTARVGIDLYAEKLPSAPGETALRIGSTTGTRLEVGSLTLSAGADLAVDHQDYGILFEAKQAAVVISGGDGDGFLKQVLPPEGLRVEFELGLGWSRSKGVYFAGAAGLEATLPVELSLFGVLNLDSVYLALRADEEGARAVTGVTTSLQLGPVAVNVERFGLQALLEFPPSGGNLGVADLQFAFKPPSGAGIAVDASVVVGGGYLFFDPERAQYAGVLQLEIAKSVSLKAIGLLTTRMPDGSEGFSLVVIVSAEGFAPIQLGFGFALTGVGGLLGVHRTVVVDALRAGIKHGTLDSILFPPDPVRNAPQILSTLGTVFPPQQGRFFFGPLAQIAWGTPAVLTIDLALVLEVPSPVRLLILGRLKAVLPEAEHAVVYLRLDALGVIDFERGDLSLDATLYDSRIAQFVVTGDMALRASWGAQPTFVLAVGGFNPRFKAPAGFPSLERVALTLATGDNPRLRLEAYLALTSNTVQFGARLEAFARAGSFTLEGCFGFDALVNTAPFSFVVDVGGMAALRHKGKLLMGITLDMVLSGPTPWHVLGKATFSILGFSHEVRFEHRIGDAEPPPLPLPVAVAPLLREALQDARNWASELPAGENPLVSFRDTRVERARLMHPLATLTVRQKVVPLGTPVTRFGSTRPSDGNLFTVAVASQDGVALAAAEVEDAFAPAQFRQMSDDQKLTGASFVSMHSGWRFATDAYAFDYGQDVRAYDTNIAYETLTVLEPDQPASTAAPHLLPKAVLQTAALFGPAGAAAIRHTGSDRYRREELVTL